MRFHVQKNQQVVLPQMLRTPLMFSKRYGKQLVSRLEMTCLETRLANHLLTLKASRILHPRYAKK